MPKGNYAALKELTPITTDLGKIARHQEQVEAQKRQEEEQKRQFNIKRQDVNNDKIDANSKAFIPSYTRFKHVDDAQTHFSEQNAQIYAQLETEIAADPMRKNPETIEKIARRDRILQTPAILANITKYWKDYSDDFISGIGSGKYSKTENKEIYDLFATMLDADFEFTLDDKDQIGMWKKGKDGKPEFIPAAELYNGTALPTPNLAFNLENYQKQMDDFSGTVEKITTDDNFNKITKEVLSDKSVTGRANLKLSTIGTAEKPTRMAMDIWRNKLGGKVDDFDFAQVEQYVDGFGKTIDEKDSKEKNFSAANAAANLRQRKLEHEYEKTQDAKEETTTTTKKGNLNLMTDTDTGEALKVPASAGLNWAEGESYVYSAGVEDVKLGTELVDVDEIYVNKDGRLAWKGTKKKDVTPEANKLTNPNPKKVYKETEVNGTYFKEGDKDLNKVAEALGFKNSHELKLKLEEKLKAHNSKPKDGETQTSKADQTRLNKLPD